MEENKTINEEMFDLIPMEDVDTETDDSGLSTPMAMLIGGGIALGIAAAGKAALRWYKRRKAAKSAPQTVPETEESEDDYVEVGDDQ